MKRILFPVAHIFLTVFLWAILPVYADTITWINTGGGNWSEATNWSPNEVPGSMDNAYITNDGSYTVTLDASATVASLTLGGASGAQSFVANANTLTLNGASTVGNNGSFNLGGGTLSGTGSFTVNGPFNWSGGTIENTGGVTLSGTSSLTGVGNDAMSLFGPLINGGTLTWSGSGNNLEFDGGTLTNEAVGTITITNDVSSDGEVGIIGNAGLLNIIGTTILTVPFVNAGNVQVQSGSLSLNGGGTESGLVNIASGAALDFSGLTHTVLAGFSAPGPGSLVISGGEVDFDSVGASMVPNLTVNGGNLGGSGSLTVNGPFMWSSGDINTTGGVMLNGTSSLNGVGNDSMSLFGPLINAGTLTWSGSGNNLEFDGGTLTNEAVGTINITNDVSSDGEVGIIGNAGVLSKSVTTGTTTLTVTFVNTGTLSAQSGTISAAGDYTLSDGTLNFGINSLTNFGTISLSRSAALTGTLSANLNNGYVPIPNNAFPILTYVSHAGSFSNTNLPPVAVWQTTYNPTNVTITVLKLVPQLIWTNPASIVYGTLLGGAQLNASAASPTNLSGSLAGTFTYTPPPGTLLLASNNQVLSVNFTPTDLATYTNVTTNVTINVLKAPVTITANNTNKIYGQTVTFAGTEFTTTALSNRSDSVTSVTLSSPGATATATVAGSPYTITNTTAVGSGLANYTITYVNGALTVNPAPLTITASAQSKTYGQTLNVGATAFTTTVLSNSDTVTSVTLSSPGAAATATVAGSPYTITNTTAVGSGLANYTITYVNGALTVNPAPLTITAGAQGKSYGQTLNLGTTAFATTVLSNSDTVTSVTLSSPGAAAAASVVGSPYAINASAPVGTGLGNYSIGYVTGPLTVTPAPLTITASAQSKTYGQPAAFGSGSPLFTSVGLENEETIDSVTLAVSGNGGAATASVTNSPYTITPSAATGGTFTATNYAVTYATGKLSVSPASLIVTASAQSKTYGQTVGFGSGSPLFTSVGLQNEETIGTVTLAVSGNGGAATASVGGSPYTIMPSAATGGTFMARNYMISYANGLLTVMEAPSLNIVASLPDIVLSWTTNASTFVLNGAASVVSPITWTPVTNDITIAGTNNTITINASSGNQYYTLIAP